MPGYYSELVKSDNATEMGCVREHSENMKVFISNVNDREVIEAYNEGGYNFTQVDLLDVVDWVKRNRPELLGS